MSFVLDTDVVSQTSKPLPASPAVEWLKRHESDDLFLSVMTISELRYGVNLLPSGKRRTGLMEFVKEVPLQFKDRVLPVTSAIADQAGVLLAASRKAGFTADLFDVIIGATALVHGFRVVTLNGKHFKQLRVPVEPL